MRRGTRIAASVLIGTSPVVVVALYAWLCIAHPFAVAVVLAALFGVAVLGAVYGLVRITYEELGD